MYWKIKNEIRFLDILNTSREHTQIQVFLKVKYSEI